MVYSLICLMICTGVPSIARSISSESREQVSIIAVEFNRDVDLEDALNDVRDKVAKSKNQLPADVDPPIVEKATSPDNLVAFLGVESQTKDIKYTMRLRFDPVKLAAYQLTPEDIRQALQRENIDLPSGRIEGNSTELSVRTNGA